MAYLTITYFKILIHNVFRLLNCSSQLNMLYSCNHKCTKCTFLSLVFLFHGLGIRTFLKRLQKQGCSGDWYYHLLPEEELDGKSLGTPYCYIW